MLAITLTIIIIDIIYDLIVSYLRNGRDYRKKFSFKKAVLRAIILGLVIVGSGILFS